MRTRLICLVLGTLAIPAIASADDHRWDGYLGGGGGNGASKLFSFHQTLNIVPLRDGVLSKVSFVVDWTTQFGKHADGTRVTQFPLAFGGRVTFSRGKDHVKPFVQALGSRIYTNDGASDATDGALVLGFGVDIVPKTAEKNTIGYRIAADHFDRTSTRENFWRVTGGVIYRFGQHGAGPGK